MNVTDLVPGLQAMLPAHLARQRWYGAKHREGVELEILAIEELTGPFPALVRVVVGAAPERYQLVLGVRPAELAPSVGETETVGVIDTDDGPVVVYDGLADPELGLALLSHVAPKHEASSVRPIAAEQSNSSLVYDERMIMKVFRRLTGANPEIEVTLGLAEAGFDHIADPLAVWRTSGDDLAVLQRFLSGGVEGWALALTSMRDVLDQGVEPTSAGGDLGPEAERLGVMTAELHLAMAEAFGVAPGDPQVWAGAMAERAASVQHPDLDRAALDAVIGRLRGMTDAGSSIRIHGDYHLGQVMRTDEGWFVLDFEGEPARPVEERRQPSSPLRDVAGMLRSLAYAAAVGVREHGSSFVDVDMTNRLPVEELAAQWERRNRNAFLTAYLARLEGSPLLPADLRASRELLAAFELDKAVYEVAYEQAHRPDWIHIPLDAVRRLIGTDLGDA